MAAALFRECLRKLRPAPDGLRYPLRRVQIFCYSLDGSAGDRQPLRDTSRQKYSPLAQR